MARTPSLNTHDQPGRANSTPGFLRRCVWTVQAVRTLIAEAGHVRELRELKGTNEWTLMQLREIAERMDNRVTFSQIIRASVDAVADASAIGELKIDECRSEANLKSTLMYRLLLASVRERDQEAAQEDQG